MDLKLNFLQHIGIPVSDLRKSELFYSSLGFVNCMASSFKHKGDEGNVSMMKNGSIIIELYQMPEIEIDNIINRKDGHIDHIAFDVTDIHETFKLLKNASFNMVEETPVFLPFWKNGCMYFNIIGPDGERLEFNQIL